MPTLNCRRRWRRRERWAGGAAVASLQGAPCQCCCCGWQAASSRRAPASPQSCRAGGRPWRRHRPRSRRSARQTRCLSGGEGEGAEAAAGKSGAAGGNSRAICRAGKYPMQVGHTHAHAQHARPRHQAPCPPSRNRPAGEKRTPTSTHAHTHSTHAPGAPPTRQEQRHQRGCLRVAHAQELEVEGEEDECGPGDGSHDALQEESRRGRKDRKCWEESRGHGRGGGSGKGSRGALHR